MAGRIALVTVGSDGFVDYVQTPDGQKHMLGPVSVLKLITGLVPTRTAREALQEFTSSNRTMLKVDLDKMWELLPFRRARYSSTTNPLIEREDRNPEISMTKSANYDAFSANVDLAEDIVAKVSQTDETIDRLREAGKRFDSVRAKADLHKIAARVTEIAENVDLAQPWVGNDLVELSKRANDIHALFHTNKIADYDKEQKDLDQYLRRLGFIAGKQLHSSGRSSDVGTMWKWVDGDAEIKVEFYPPTTVLPHPTGRFEMHFRASQNHRVKEKFDTKTKESGLRKALREVREAAQEWVGKFSTDA